MYSSDDLINQFNRLSLLKQYLLDLSLQLFKCDTLDQIAQALDSSDIEQNLSCILSEGVLLFVYLIDN